MKLKPNAAQKRPDDAYSPEETAQRRDALLLWALKTPPKPLKKQDRKLSRAKPATFKKKAQNK